MNFLSKQRNQKSWNRSNGKLFCFEVVYSSCWLWVWNVLCDSFLSSCLLKNTEGHFICRCFDFPLVNDWRDDGVSQSRFRSMEVEGKKSRTALDRNMKEMLFVVWKWNWDLLESFLLLSPLSCLRLSGVPSLSAGWIKVLSFGVILFEWAWSVAWLLGLV